MDFDDPSAAIDLRHYEQRGEYAERLQAEQASIAAEMAALAATCEMSEWCNNLPTVTDYDRPPMENGKRPERRRTIGEALDQALDSLKRPDHSDAMALICRAARGDNVQADAAAMLRVLCDRIGEQFAEVE